MPGRVTGGQVGLRWPAAAAAAACISGRPLLLLRQFARSPGVVARHWNSPASGRGTGCAARETPDWRSLKNTMLTERKPVVKSTDMSEDMQQDAVNTAVKPSPHFT